MNATTTPRDLAEEIKSVTDQDTALKQLYRARKTFAMAVETARTDADALYDGIIEIRPLGLLTVDEMGKAIGQSRNYVDRMWALYNRDENRDGDDTGQTRIRQTRVPVVDADAVQARAAYDRLGVLADNHRRSTAGLAAARTARNRTVAVVYASRILGPSTIAEAVGIDRNHVLRLARRAGVPPMHRRGVRNQYSR